MKNLHCLLKGHNLKAVTTDCFQNQEFECSKCQQKYTASRTGRPIKLNQSWIDNEIFFEEHFKKVS